MNALSNTTLIKIIEAASTAPSGDNSQPWEFVVEKGIIYQYFIEGKDNPFLNYKNGGTLLANGAALENIALASETYGFDAVIEYFPISDDHRCVAKVHFEPNGKTQERTNGLHQRHTNRRSYTEDPIDPLIKEKLLHCIEDIGGVRVVITEDRGEIVKCAWAGSRAEIAILENQELHNHLFSGVTWSKDEENKKRTGLFVKTLELNPIQELFFTLCRYWKLMRLFNKIKFAHFIAHEDAKNYATGGAYVAVLASGSTPLDFIKAGRAMERMWISLNQQNYAVHPIIASLFFALRIKDGEDASLLPAHRTLMAQASQAIDTVFATRKDEHVLVLFRTGKALPPSARSSKKPPVVSYK